MKDAWRVDVISILEATNFRHEEHDIANRISGTMCTMYGE